MLRTTIGIKLSLLAIIITSVAGCGRGHAPASKVTSDSAAVAPTSHDSCKDALVSGQAMTTGDLLCSPNKRFYALMRYDGSFTLFDSIEKPVWTMWTTSTTTGRKLTMQTDCNLVLADKNNLAVWNSQTRTNDVTNCQLVIHDDGNMILYGQKFAPTVSIPVYQALWTSETTGMKASIDHHFNRRLPIAIKFLRDIPLNEEPSIIPNLNSSPIQSVFSFHSRPYVNGKPAPEVRNCFPTLSSGQTYPALVGGSGCRREYTMHQNSVMCRIEGISFDLPRAPGEPRLFTHLLSLKGLELREGIEVEPTRMITDHPMLAIGTFEWVSPLAPGQTQKTMLSINCMYENRTGNTHPPITLADVAAAFGNQKDGYYATFTQE